MKRFLVVLVVMLAAVGAVGDSMVWFNSDISVTQTNTATVFTDNGSSGTGSAFLARTVLVRSLSTSANTCYFKFRETTGALTTAATSSDTAMAPSDSVTFTYPGATNANDGWAGMDSICTTGQTATFRVTATR